MIGLKRWLGALVAVLFLSTATLHAFAHVGAADNDGCAVCSVQQAGAVAAPAPAIVAAPVDSVSVAEPSAPSVCAASLAAAPARAPPSSRA
jgi:hypothetical protein